MHKRYAKCFAQSLLLCGLVFGLSLPAWAAERVYPDVPHVLPFEGAVNFRDIGGYTTEDGRRVKRGIAYRSDHLHELTAEDWERVTALDIDLVFDLRRDAERDQWPSNWPDGYQVQVVSRDYDLGSNREGYQSLAYALEENYRTMFDELADPANGSSTALIHCTAGQDRTGFAVAFLLTILGVDRQTILDDYSLSHHLRGLGGLDLERLAEIRDFYGLDQSLDAMIKRRTSPQRRSDARQKMAEALDAIAAEHGSLIDYVRKNLDVDDAEIQRIRARLLD